MDTGTGALVILGVRLADAAIAVTAALLVVLAAIAAITLVRFCLDVKGRFAARGVADGSS
ncbi:hypothetical protein [Bradyrhizobium sp. Cp5.3]|uniref:hypothetical protein n=1 Tax=Bradyrhizobium sp. Cp5.3 TaxID=443598 RepID=UPI0012EC6E2B|nr:hypothetical protein [Bradyrhizobium sp. Cp5.3]